LSEAIGHLADEQLRGAAWALLFYVLEDQTPPEDLGDLMKNAICSADIVDLVREDVPTGLSALRTASLQMANLGDEALRSHLKEQLILSAAYLAEEKRRDGVVGIDLGAFDEQRELRHLMDSAVHLSAAIEGDGAFAEFAELLSRLTEAWPATVPFCKLVVMRLCEQLDPQKARPFWRVLVRLRAQ
jgi:hypothetical protein